MVEDIVPLLGVWGEYNSYVTIGIVLMGIILDYQKIPNEEDLQSRLLVYMKMIKDLKEPVSVSKVLADELLKCDRNRRSIKIENLFQTVLSTYPDGVIIKDIDVMFNPDYKIDVLRILVNARKNKRYSVIWPGRLENNKLIYSEAGFSDYKEFDIDNYDIAFIRISDGRT